MSDPAAGYYPPPPSVPRYALPPEKPRPSAWWFLPCVVTVGLAIAAVVVAVVAGVRLFRTDGYVSADGSAQAVHLGAGEHMLFVEDPGFEPPACTGHGARDRVTLSPVSSSSTVSVNDATWTPFAKVSTTDQDVRITCDGVGERIRVGAPVGGSRIVVIAVSIIAAVVLGLAGTVALVVVAVLWFSRKPRTVSG